MPSMMANKHSHRVVLAQYSSRGLINLPNDQYIEYLSSRDPSPTTSKISTPSQGSDGRSAKLQSFSRAPTSNSWNSTHAGSVVRGKEPRRGAPRRVILDLELDGEAETTEVVLRSDGGSLRASTVELLEQVRYDTAILPTRAKPLPRGSARDDRSSRSKTSSNGSHISRPASTRKPDFSVMKTNRPSSRHSPTYDGDNDIRGSKGEPVFPIKYQDHVSRQARKPQQAPRLRTPPPVDPAQPQKANAEKHPVTAMSRMDSYRTQETQIYDPLTDDLDFEGFSDSNEPETVEIPVIIKPGSTSSPGGAAPQHHSVRVKKLVPAHSTRRHSSAIINHHTTRYDSFSSPSSHGSLRSSSDTVAQSTARATEEVVQSSHHTSLSAEQESSGPSSIFGGEGEGGTFSPSIFEAVEPTTPKGEATSLSPRDLLIFKTLGMDPNKETDSLSASETSAAIPPDIAKHKIRTVESFLTQSPKSPTSSRNSPRIAKEEEMQEAEKRLKELKKDVYGQSMGRDMARKDAGASKLFKRFRGSSTNGKK